MRTSPFQSETRANEENAEETRSSMPFAETRYSRYLFQRESIVQNAPECSGVYGLFNAFWIYIGEAENLRARILEHLKGDDPSIVRFQPSGFAFERISPNDRLRRHEQLIRELQPLCNTSSNGKLHG